MPFIKRGPAHSETTISETPISQTRGGERSDAASDHLDALRSPDAEARWIAARALGGRDYAVAALAGALETEDVPRVREAIMTALLRTGDDASVEALLPCMRSQNAGVRAAAIEVLQALPDRIPKFLPSLLSDPDIDVRILATELTRNLPAAEATRLLCGLLQKEQHPNVCGAAIEILAEVGTGDALGVLKTCGERFAAAPFLPFAVSTAIARISNTER
jgi:HEAT repeat protein